MTIPLFLFTRHPPPKLRVTPRVAGIHLTVIANDHCIALLCLPAQVALEVKTHTPIIFILELPLTDFIVHPIPAEVFAVLPAVRTPARCLEPL